MYLTVGYTSENLPPTLTVSYNIFEVLTLLVENKFHSFPNVLILLFRADVSGM